MTLAKKRDRGLCSIVDAVKLNSVYQANMVGQTELIT